MEADPIPRLNPRFGSDPVSMEASLRSPLPSSFQPRLVGAALMNLGNTCYLNAVLQCLTHTVPLVEKIIDSECSSCSCGEKERFCSFLALKDHIKHCLVSSEHYVSPKDIAENLSKISPGLQLGQQEDAHEFLQSLLDAVHTCCHNCTATDCPSTLDEDSIVKQVFGGRLKSQLRCCSCGHRSDTYEPLLDLSLEIGDANSIMDALASFTKVEKIEDNVKLTCDGCKDQVSMEKQLKLEQAPEVLALHLKRFETNGLFSNKISKHVEYPLELDLNRFLVCPAEEVQLKYDLYAVVVHLGSSYSGHYFSIIRSSETAWYQMDDTQVTNVSETEVLDQTAYILFYIKKGSSGWFSSLLDTEKIRCLERTAHTSPISVLDYVDSDLQLNSAQETGCCTSRAMPEKCESSRKYNHTSLISPATDTSPVHKPIYDASKPTNFWNHANGSEKVIKDESLTQLTLRSPLTQSHKRRLSDQHVVDVFAYEPLEDEEEAILPQVQVVPKVKKCTVVKPAFEAIKDERMIESFNRGLRGMPRSRREGLLACLASKNLSSEKHPPTRMLGQRIGNKRRFC